MFDDGEGRRGRPPDRAAALADLERRLADLGAGPGRLGGWRTPGLAPIDDVSAGRRSSPTGPSIPVLPVPAPLAAVLPAGGVPRGSTVALRSDAPGGDGVTSLLLTLLAADPQAWIAIVGFPGLLPAAAAQMGVDLTRVGLIPDPGPDPGRVLSVLIDGVDIIAFHLGVAAPPPARRRVLAGRLRESGAVLFVTGAWPGADLEFAVTGVRWSGLGRGHGRLTDRELDVAIGGRRAGAGGSATMLLRAGRDTVLVTAPVGAAEGTRHSWSTAQGGNRADRADAG